MFEHGVLSREKFVEECEKFSSKYDLTGDGKRQREAIKSEKLEELIKKTEILKSGEGFV